MGVNSGEFGGGAARKTLNLLSSTYLPPSFENCKSNSKIEIASQE